MTIPYYMEIMGVDRPDRTYENSSILAFVDGAWRGPLFRCRPPGPSAPFWRLPPEKKK